VEVVETEDEKPDEDKENKTEDEQNQV